MSEPASAAWLTTGPRGRRLLWSLLDAPPAGPAWLAAWADRPVSSGADLVAELRPVGGAVAHARPGLFDAFADATAFARYWQEPDGVDQALARPEVRDALLPLAQTVSAAAPAWWADPVDRFGQRIVDWVDPNATPTSLTGAADKLRAWRAATMEDEQRAVERPRDVHARWSGRWWSAPCLSGLPTTTRALPGLGAAGLELVEDGMGWTAAGCRPVAIAIEPRVFDIVDGEDWIGLVERYPLEVSLSRRHDWWRATGVEGSWLIPDYAAVSHDYDAVHLTARGYLSAAGVALPAGSARTVLAGWDPDQTYWLTDCLVADRPPERWTRDQNADIQAWTRSSGSGRHRPARVAPGRSEDELEPGPHGSGGSTGGPERRAARDRQHDPESGSDV